MLAAVSAVTVYVKGVPAEAVAGAVTKKCVVTAVTPGVTLIEVLAPSRAAVTVSWAYTNCRGPVESVTVKVPTPLVKTEDAGKLWRCRRC